MNRGLRIEFDWLESQIGSDLERAFAASIGLAVGEEYLTRLDDSGAKTVRNQVRASAWPLAMWFASNWWRLRWEPAPEEWQNNLEWRMAHCLAAAGGGFVWPNVVFASDGSEIEIATKTKYTGARFEPVYYINQVQTRIVTTNFEQSVDTFMTSVLDRSHTLGLPDNDLSKLWADILAERSDPTITQQRKLEAMAGFDPDQAPDEWMERLLEDPDNLGKLALTELVAETRQATGVVLNTIHNLSQASRKPKPGGFRACLPKLQLSPSIGIGRHPWQIGSEIARYARSTWDLGTKPIPNKILADLLLVDKTVFSDASTVPISAPIGIRTTKNDTFDIYLDRQNPTTRRFAVTRLLGDHLYFDNNERLIPATHAKTSRQKFQRAFAQEFLCPIDALLDKIQTTQPNEDDISEAADHFHVSPLMVRTTLVNHNQLDREALMWAD